MNIDKKSGFIPVRRKKRKAKRRKTFRTSRSHDFYSVRNDDD